MRTFRRTRSGLNNQHLFHNVDLVVFLEGGNASFTKNQVLDGQYHEETEDIIFWKNIFKKFAPNKNIKFKSVGSKTTIKEIAIEIMDGNLTTVFVAMDNEFDEILKKRLEHKQIYYTHGYSWENDVWNQTVIKTVIEELTAVEIDNTDLDRNFNVFLNQIKAAVNADAYLFKKGSSFFPRKAGIMFCVECTPADLPFIKTDVLNNKFIEKNVNRKNVNAFGLRHKIQTLKFCYGHLLADYCCQLISHYLRKRHTLPSVHKDIIYRMGLNKFFLNHFEEGEVYDYYRSQFIKNEA
ncbi:DUF4435 domain-containing protein [Flavobacterium sp. YJ01]|uniref:DUF4435 domain-containing protein n=1 Tax=unclassified Flavobacterium TaxID=196869 RepID=UPI0023E383DE|nr:DUF4435 domain-containing protein [Flavobacterium sp. YJ01]WET03725.1 DUF4435 domain-containing protein [Flavobacterium sp. YJ01]